MSNRIIRKVNSRSECQKQLTKYKHRFNFYVNSSFPYFSSPLLYFRQIQPGICRAFLAHFEPMKRVWWQRLLFFSSNQNVHVNQENYSAQSSYMFLIFRRPNFSTL